MINHAKGNYAIYLQKIYLDSNVANAHTCFNFVIGLPCFKCPIIFKRKYSRKVSLLPSESVNSFHHHIELQNCSISSFIFYILFGIYS